MNMQLLSNRSFPFSFTIAYVEELYHMHVSRHDKVTLESKLECLKWSLSSISLSLSRDSMLSSLCPAWVSRSLFGISIFFLWERASWGKSTLLFAVCPLNRGSQSASLSPCRFISSLYRVLKGFIAYPSFHVSTFSRFNQQLIWRCFPSWFFWIDWILSLMLSNVASDGMASINHRLFLCTHAHPLRSLICILSP